MSTERELEAGQPDPEAEAFLAREARGESLPTREKAAPQDDDDDPPPARKAPKPSAEFDPSAKEEKPAADPDEERAARMGWAPKDQWRGAPEKWVDAKTFVERANPAILLERMDKMAKDYESTVQRLERMNQAALDKQQREYQQQIADLKAQRDADVIRVARESGEAAARRRAGEWDQHIAEQEAPQQVHPREVEKTSAREAWLQTRSEFNTNKAFKAAAVEVMQDIYDENPDRPYAEQFKELDKRLAVDFPHIYKTPAANGNDTGAPPPDARSMDGVRIGGPKRTNYASRLNNAEKAQGARFVKQGVFKDLEAYAKSLHEEENA